MAASPGAAPGHRGRRAEHPFCAPIRPCGRQSPARP